MAPNQEKNKTISTPLKLDSFSSLGLAEWEKPHEHKVFGGFSPFPRSGSAVYKKKLNFIQLGSNLDHSL